jgi:hypothetical protein
MGKRASQLQDLPLAQQRSACPLEASSGQIIARHCWHSTILHSMSSTVTLASSNSKGGHKLLCANLADLALTGAARDCGLVVTGAAGLSAGHLANPAPTDVAHSCGLAVAGAAGLSAGHGPLRVALGRGPTIAIGLRWM